MITDDDIGRVIAQLALNYNRGIDDEDAAIGLITIWRSGIGGCAVEDVDAALQTMLADPDVKFFPTVADFRLRVLAANRVRREQAEAVSAEVDGRGTVSCITCMDSGWLNAGVSDEGYEWVRPCPKGCLPPLRHHRTRPATYVGRRRAPTDAPVPVQLSTATVEAAVAGQARMVGDRDEEF